MYETRGAVRGLTTTKTQKNTAKSFFEAIEKVQIGARTRNGDSAAAAAKDAIALLDAFTATL